MQSEIHSEMLTELNINITKILWACYQNIGFLEQYRNFCFTSPSSVQDDSRGVCYEVRRRRRRIVEISACVVAQRVKSIQSPAIRIALIGLSISITRLVRAMKRTENRSLVIGKRPASSRNAKRQQGPQTSVYCARILVSIPFPSLPPSYPHRHYFLEFILIIWF